MDSMLSTDIAAAKRTICLFVNWSGSPSLAILYRILIYCCGSIYRKNILLVSTLNTSNHMIDFTTVYNCPKKNSHLNFVFHYSDFFLPFITKNPFCLKHVMLIMYTRELETKDIKPHLVKSANIQRQPVEPVLLLPRTGPNLR